MKKKDEKKKNEEKEIKIEESIPSEENNEDVKEEKIETEPLEILNRIEELEKEKFELKDALLRRSAEFENYKKRVEADQINLFKYAGEAVIMSILPVYDDLQRSLTHAEDEKNNKSFLEGLRLVFDKFSKILEEAGVVKIEAKGKPFDFNYHAALMQREADDVPPHTVLEEIESGYMYKDKVIRHAKVIVSQQSAKASESEKENAVKPENDIKE